MYTPHLGLLKQRRKQGIIQNIFSFLLRRVRVQIGVALALENFWGEKAMDPLGGYEISGICSFYYVKNH